MQLYYCPSTYIEKFIGKHLVQIMNILPNISLVANSVKKQEYRCMQITSCKPQIVQTRCNFMQTCVGGITKDWGPGSVVVGSLFFVLIVVVHLPYKFNWDFKNTCHVYWVIRSIVAS
jgi:hypothetical protein